MSAKQWEIYWRDAAKKKLKRMYMGIGDIARMLQDSAGLSAKTIKKYSKIWKSNPLNLEVLLQHQELDVGVDFTAKASSDTLAGLRGAKVNNRTPTAEANGDEKNVSSGNSQLHSTLANGAQEEIISHVETDRVENRSECHGKNVESVNSYERDIILQEGKQNQVIRSNSLNERHNHT